uniref:Uracil-DNA glycosylase n=1 Tax=Phallusia mammillata TaxID=59560 RepID=A0A6F9DVN3_9ASCI|nr:uracil-DNA glycosylase [Phallusia mammillata]
MWRKNFVKMNKQKKISSFFETKPTSTIKRSATNQTENTVPCSKQAKVESPNKENCAPSIQYKQQIGSSWKQALGNEFVKPYYVKLQSFVETERKSRTIYPPPNDVFSWTQHCSIQDVKVVILGQDPYHGQKQAHGLCFSVQNGVQSPPSLVNIFKELEKDINGFQTPPHGNLTVWAKQGVLLLNAVLTVQASNANSHKDKGWEKFTDAVISYLNKNCTGLVFMLWGSYAQKKGAKINAKSHLVLKAVHPSPLSAYRGFFGCKHFSKANEYLKKHGKDPIQWGSL